DVRARGAPSMTNALYYGDTRTARCVCACVGSAIFLLATLGAAAAETKQVLMLHSFDRDVKPWSAYAKNIRAELEQQSRWPLEISDHSLITADEASEAAFAEYLRALHANRPVDLIVSVGAPAVAFVQRHRQDLFATTPMVFTAVEQRRIRYSTLTANDTVVAFAHSFPQFSRTSCGRCPTPRSWQRSTVILPTRNFGSRKLAGRGGALQIALRSHGKMSFRLKRY